METQQQHERTYLKDSEILLGQVPKIDPPIRLEIESQLAAIPNDKHRTRAVRARLTIDTQHRRSSWPNPSVRPSLDKWPELHSHP